MRSLKHHAALSGLLIGLIGVTSCSNDDVPAAGNGSLGTIGLQLQIAPGVTINTVNWTITNATSGFNQAGSVNQQFSNTIQFQAGGLPAGAGYVIALNAVSVDGSFTCAGSATFSVTAAATTTVGITLTCNAGAAGAGTIVVDGTTVVCANLNSLSAAPLETTVNNPIALAATASAGPLTPTFAWTASAGDFDNAASAAPIFTCPATPGPVTITVTVSPSGPTCTSTTSQSVTVSCDTLSPTFTNVYANVIGARCIGCHKPGGSGVTVGGLDMSTQAKAYVDLVNVPAAGTGAGTSGVTCASLSPALLRVVPNNSAGSLIFEKVNSKLQSLPAPCGSPMPLPATAVALTQAQVDLIAGWIDAGALNN
jgi:hypothetical protein